MAVLRLRSERVVLRALVADDAGALFEAYGDPEVLRYWLSAPHSTVKDTARLITDDTEQIASSDDQVWAIALRENPRAIGRITLSDVDRDHGRGTLGFLLTRAHWGRGLASEAQRLVLGHAFAELGLRRVEAFTDPRNSASVRSLERLGFRREGLLRERWQVGDECRDDVVYGLLGRDWHAVTVRR